MNKFLEWIETIIRVRNIAKTRIWGREIYLKDKESWEDLGYLKVYNDESISLKDIKEDIIEDLEEALREENLTIISTSTF